MSLRQNGIVLDQSSQVFDLRVLGGQQFLESLDFSRDLNVGRIKLGEVFLSEELNPAFLQVEPEVE